MSKVKFITFYLPQYHVIPENNKWWGDGFTEWTRVKNARPLFKDHLQPKVPYNYYDLSSVDSMIQQSDMALKYGIDGFCYYHYWFNGKLLLEKPVEQMLENKNVKIPFCLSWANEPWTRAWEGKKNEILIDQVYGDESGWTKHIEYLLPFFKDKRYIRIDNKPIFLIYRTSAFKHFDEMIDHWERYLKKNGIPGIYIIETLNSFQKKPYLKKSSAIVEFEPMFTLKRKGKNLFDRLKNKIHYYFSIPNKISYDKVWGLIVKRNIDYNKKRFLGAFVNWDNTPRFGRRGTIFIGATPTKFKKYLQMQVKKSTTGDYIFINAWNEWAEGTYLEPDNYNGYEFLEVINTIKKSLNE
jgi:hypothetical protein